MAVTEQIDASEVKDLSLRQPASECPACGFGHTVPVRFCTRCGAALDPDAVATAGEAQLRVDPNDSHYIGRVIEERYRVVSVIGRGGMGCVYKVEQIHLRKTLALKMLHENMMLRKSQVNRFLREARAISRLESPHTVRLFDFGRYGEIFYLVMELLEGQELDVLLDDVGTLPPERVMRILGQICDSLIEAHEAGIVHRDLKPENVMVVPGPDGEMVKVLDFGLAKIRDAEDLVTIQTGRGMFGTPYYMAPEQIRNVAVDGRTDIYALGAMAFRLLTGTYAFTADTTFDVLKKHLSEPVPSMRVRTPDRRIPAALDRLVMRCMAKSPDDRWKSARDLKAALLECLGDSDGGVSEEPLVPPVVMDRAPAADSARPDDDHPAAPQLASFERRLARRRIVASLAVAIVAVVGVVLAWSLWSTVDMHRTSGLEREPNNAVESADTLRLGVAVKGTLGQRISASDGDRDIYALEVASPGMLEVSLSGLPAVDAVLEVLDAKGRLVAAFDHQGRGEGEQVHFFPVEAGRVHLAVREQVKPGAIPRESVSDWYELTAGVSPKGEATEVEVNDFAARATPLQPGTQLSAHIDGRADLDLYVLDPKGQSATRWTIELQARERLRLALELHNARDELLFSATTAGAGLAETIEFVTPADNTPTRMLTVKAVPGSAMEGAYTLKVTRVPERPTAEFEPNDDPDQANAVLLGQTVDGEVGGRDEDVFRIRSGGLGADAIRVVLTAKGPRGPSLWARDESGSWVSAQSVTEPGRSSETVYDVEARGRDALVRVAVRTGRGTVPYTLRVEPRRIDSALGPGALGAKD